MIFQAPASTEAEQLSRTTTAILYDDQNKIFLKKPINGRSSDWPMHIADGDRLFWMSGWSQKSKNEFQVFYKQCRGPKQPTVGDIRIN